MGNKEVAPGGKTDHFYGVYSLRKSTPIPFSHFWERVKRHTRDTEVYLFTKDKGIGLDWNCL